MSKVFVIVFLFFLYSCGDKKANLTENKPVDATDFFNAFTKIKLPYSVSDTSLLHAGDTTTISEDVLKQFIPDSTLQTLSAKGSGLIIHPIGKIENKTELYLLTRINSGKKTSLLTFLFDSKHHYLNRLLLLSSPDNDDYVHTVDINTEPTFILTQNKTVKEQYSYTKKGYAYSTESKSFIEVIHDSNEGVSKDNEIINPIDTLARTFRYSGDYVKDKSNFISLRDGNTPNRYLFFLHLEKNKDECVGELKGYLLMIGADKAVFQQSGDPCVIDFVFFEKNGIKVKERGSCGNHRGITCLFDDTYKKKMPIPVKATKKKK